MIFLLDSHCDAPLMLAKGADFEKKVEQGFVPGSFPITHIDYPRMKKGGVNGAFFAIYTSNSLAPDESTRRAFELVSKVYDSVENSPGKVAFATTPSQARRNARNGLISVFLGMENGAPIQNDLSLLRMFHRLGIRYLTLTHARSNQICDSCTSPEPVWHGLSPFGREVVAECNRLGIMVDVSHISDESFWDVIKYSKSPVIASHSCCRALCNHPRNLTDEMIKAIAHKGGVVQINFYPKFLSEEYGKAAIGLDDKLEEADYAWREDSSNPQLQANLQKAYEEYAAVPRPSYKVIVDHIEHVIKLVGVKHVGIGSDFDGIEFGPKGLEDISKMQKIIIELRKRGYSEYDIKLIAGGNFLRVMEAVQNPNLE
ncbi:MAG: dipeptidase [Bacteroidales bacterium]|nr:dipeptidase [Candidatus Cacconaster merdequi]